MARGSREVQYDFRGRRETGRNPNNLGMRGRGEASLLGISGTRVDAGLGVRMYDCALLIQRGVGDEGASIAARALWERKRAGRWILLM